MTRKELNRWARSIGLRRRWFGLEPNFMLEQRIVQEIIQ